MMILNNLGKNPIFKILHLFHVTFCFVSFINWSPYMWKTYVSCSTDRGFSVEAKFWVSVKRIYVQRLQSSSQPRPLNEQPPSQPFRPELNCTHSCATRVEGFVQQMKALQIFRVNKNLAKKKTKAGQVWKLTMLHIREAFLSCDDSAASPSARSGSKSVPIEEKKASRSGLRASNPCGLTW